MTKATGSSEEQDIRRATRDVHRRRDAALSRIDRDVFDRGLSCQEQVRCPWWIEERCPCKMPSQLYPWPG